MPYYRRAPRADLIEALRDERKLAFLLSPDLRLGELAALTDGHKGKLDVQFRDGNRLMLYTGSTYPLTVKVAGERVKFSAADSYVGKHAKMIGAGLMRYGLFRPSGKAGSEEGVEAKMEWRIDSPELPAAVRSYLRHLLVDERWTGREAEVQMRWAQIAGPEPWTYLDREAVLGYETGETAPLAPLQEAWDQLRREVRGPWPAFSLSVRADGSQASELDQLAIDPDGRLVLIELKFAMAPASFIYGAPFQLLEYIYAWRDALLKDGVLGQLQQLVDAKVSLGLLPKGLPRLTGELRPAIAFGEWLRPGPELHRKFWATVRVANAFLPPGVPPIEVWSLEDDAGPLPVVQPSPDASS